MTHLSTSFLHVVNGKNYTHTTVWSLKSKKTHQLISKRLYFNYIAAASCKCVDLFLVVVAYLI